MSQRVYLRRCAHAGLVRLRSHQARFTLAKAVIVNRIDTSAGSQFDLMRRFLLLSLIAICLASAVSAALMSRFLTHRLLQRDAELTRDFVQNIVKIELGRGYSLEQPGASKALVEFLKHVAAMPDVARANVYGKDSTLLWSSEHGLGQGRKYGDNPELAEALKGHLEIESGEVGVEATAKAEHLNLGKSHMRFVEMYIPMRDAGTNAVIGVVEVYRIPSALSQAIEAGTVWTWMISAGVGIFLYLVLFWIVRRADQLIRSQQEQLIESETTGALGEMAAAVAHGIRNPLSSIRSSAELWHDAPGAVGGEAADDIIAEVQRIEQWIRELLTYSQLPDYRTEVVKLQPLIAQCIAGFAREAERRRVTIDVSLPDECLEIRGNAPLLMQVLNNLICNALEAMPPQGGAIAIATHSNGRHREVGIEIGDTGSGIAPEDLGRICQPFFTTKTKGLGVGLTLVRRTVKRFGGRVHIESAWGKGTVITLYLLTV
ncbi:ATP-binding protein [Telluria aromaticivorans]|uniref:histidine kinase n=1 Tax=Telluria aromaticivorans TaxID=2725995 RepID=A0A7Y2P1U4_9BURK|nr:ATP-binding protein [Telluria aromaticivorans]NNG25588.1 two-component sensor histidine kinase [Telluria aromaticivorans]